jgi:hypothetical protein
MTSITLNEYSNNLITEFKSICKSINFSKGQSITKANKIPDSFKLDFKYPLLRGILLEDILIQKILLLNKFKSIYTLEGRSRIDKNTNQLFIRLSSVNHKLTKSRKEASENLIENLLFKKAFKLSQLKWFDAKLNTFNSTIFDHSEVKLKGLKIFKANNRCLAKVSIDYCFIDLIIDQTIIDLKTDINTESLKKYVKQVFTQAIMYSSFLKLKRQYQINFSNYDIEMINYPVTEIAIYYWRSNEFFKYNIGDLLSFKKFTKLVNIYTELYISHATELRKIIKKDMFP